MNKQYIQWCVLLQAQSTGGLGWIARRILYVKAAVLRLRECLTEHPERPTRRWGSHFQ